MTYAICFLLLLTFYPASENKELLAEQDAATIPESLARAGRSLTGGHRIPSGPPPTLEGILAQTDAVVRGNLTISRSYMSDDQRDVLTDYEVIAPTVFYQREGTSQVKPGPAPKIVVTFRGGTVTLGGLHFTSDHEALPLPKEQGEYLLLLKKSASGKYIIAGDYYGAFLRTGSRLVPLTQKQGFAPSFRERPESEALATIVDTLRQRPK